MNSPFLASAMLKNEGCATDSFKPLSSGPADLKNRRGWLTRLVVSFGAWMRSSPRD